jgi:hypothetical protein
MKTEVGLPSGGASAGEPDKRRFLAWPSSRLGWWSGALEATFAVLFMINSFMLMSSTVEPQWMQSVLPFYGILMLLCGLAAGVLGLIAVMRRNERSWLVWLAMLPGLFVLFLLLGEIVVPH